MKKIAVIGAGTMGNGIAHAFAQKNYKVTLKDISKESLEKAISTIDRNLDIMLSKEKITDKEKINLKTVETKLTLFEMKILLIPQVILKLIC